MKKIKLVLAVLISASLSASAFAANATGGCAGVAVGSHQKNKGAFDTTFSATNVIDIDLSAVFTPGAAQRFSKTHRLEVKVFTPNGSLYQSIAVPFSADEKKRGGKSSLTDYPDPLPTEVLEPTTFKNGKHYAAKVKLPVAGTMIVSNALYGKWTASAFVDGEMLPCASAATFTITQ